MNETIKHTEQGYVGRAQEKSGIITTVVIMVKRRGEQHPRAVSISSWTKRLGQKLGLFQQVGGRKRLQSHLYLGEGPSTLPSSVHTVLPTFNVLPSAHLSKSHHSGPSSGQPRASPFPGLQQYFLCSCNIGTIEFAILNSYQLSKYLPMGRVNALLCTSLVSLKRQRAIGGRP